MTELADPLLSGAVLIGTSYYDTLGEIGAVHNNLVLLADVLRDDRFWGLPEDRCSVVEDPATTADMLDPLLAAAHDATDTLLLYYAGHGLVDSRRGELHLALTGSDPQRMYTAVPYDNVRDILLDSRADRRIVILDCCYSGRALGQLAISADAAVDAASTNGTYVLAASAENKAALARPGEKYTAFTGELLNIIQNGIPSYGPVLDLDSIYSHLRSAMKSKGLPVPQKRERNAAGQLPLIRNQAYRHTAVIGDIDDESQETVVPTETIPLAKRLVFASEMGGPDDGPFRIVSGAAPCHFVLTREGDRVRLRNLENGHGPFINGEPVKEVLLGPEDYFDFYNSRYRLSTDGSCFEVAPLFPAALIVYRLGAATGNYVRLTQMSFVLRERSLLAILGPSGAGKTTLFSALVGELRPVSGELYLGALPLRTHGAQIRERLGFVPQDEALFKTFTVLQWLRYTYELRGAGTKAIRDARVVEVCEQLEISAQINQLIGTLSGGQRKRVSIAAELLNKPSLLMLDEPTSGLDADMDLEILRMLRNYAEAGNTVIVTTHSTEHLRLANQVLVLASGGRPVYFGPPGQILKTLYATTYASLMRKLANDSGSLADAYQRGPTVVEARAVAERMATEQSAADSSFTGRGQVMVGLRQFGVLLRRQVAQVRARGSLNRSDKYHPVRWLTGILTVVAPLLIAGGGAILVGLVSGPDGLGRGEGIQGSTSAATTLTLLITLSMLTGQALTYSDIVNDYPTIRREHRTGTFTLPVMAAKWMVFAAIAVLQALLITWIYVALRPPPTYSLFFGPVTGLFADLALMSVAAMTLGLLISAAAKNLEQAITLVTCLSIAQVALNGLLFNLSISRGIRIASMLLPYRWGLAAVAASINLRRISPSVNADALWYHSVPQWGVDLAALTVLTAAYFLIAYKILAGRLQRPD